MVQIRGKDPRAAEAQAKQKQQNTSKAAVPAGAFQGKDRVSFSGKDLNQYNLLGQGRYNGPADAVDGSKRNFSKGALAALITAPLALQKALNPSQARAQNVKPEPSTQDILNEAKKAVQPDFQLKDAMASTVRTPDPNPIPNAVKEITLYGGMSAVGLTVSAANNPKFVIHGPEDPSKLRFEVNNFINPFTRQKETYRFPVNPNEMTFQVISSKNGKKGKEVQNTGVLKLKTPYGKIIPANSGAQLIAEPGAFMVSQGQNKKFLSPELKADIVGGEGAIGFLRAYNQVPYMPTNTNYFPRFNYNAPEATVRKNQPITDVNEAKNKLAAFLTPGMATHKDFPLSRLNMILDGTDPEYGDTAKKVFSTNGVVNYNLIAALLSLSGTGFERTIRELLKTDANKNPIYSVIADQSLGANIAIADNDEKTGHKLIRINSELQGDNIQALSSLLVHEALHSDRQPSLLEEYNANLIQAYVYLKQLLRNPEAAKAAFRENTLLVRNTNLLMLEFFNSGYYGFPSPGIEEPVHDPSKPNRTLPGSANVEPSSSWHASLEKFYKTNIKGVPDLPEGTPGNPLLDDCMTVILGQLVTGQKFNTDTLKQLDASRFFSDAELQILVRDIFELTPETVTTQFDNLYVEGKPSDVEDDRLFPDKHQ